MRFMPGRGNLRGVHIWARGEHCNWGCLSKVPVMLCCQYLSHGIDRRSDYRLLVTSPSQRRWLDPQIVRGLECSLTQYEGYYVILWPFVIIQSTLSV